MIGVVGKMSRCREEHGQCAEASREALHLDGCGYSGWALGLGVGRKVRLGADGAWHWHVCNGEERPGGGDGTGLDMGWWHGSDLVLTWARRAAAGRVACCR